MNMIKVKSEDINVYSSGAGHGDMEVVMTMVVMLTLVMVPTIVVMVTVVMVWQPGG